MLIDIKKAKIFKDLKMPDLIKTDVLHLVSQGKSHKKEIQQKQILIPHHREISFKWSQTWFPISFFKMSFKCGISRALVYCH